MSSNTLRWGMLGTGNICNDFAVALNFTETPNSIVAVGASSLLKAQAFVQKRAPAAVAYGSYADVLSDQRVEIVYIGLRLGDHFEWTLRSLDAGKHVVCEKPVGMDVRQTEIMVEKAREKGLFLMQGYWAQFSPVYRELRRLVADKSELGSLQFVNVHFGYKQSGFLNPERGEIMVTTLGCHTVMMAQHLFGRPPKSIQWNGEKNAMGGDAFSIVRLNFGPNEDAALLWDERHFFPNEGFLAFENGYVKVHGSFWCPTEITIKPNNGAVEHKVFQLNDESLRSEFHFPNSALIHFGQDHVFERIRGGNTESDIMPLDDILNLQRTVDSIRNQIGVRFPTDQ